MATFYNQAKLTFDGKTLTSNQTEGEVVTRVTLTKTAVSSDYGPDENIVYAITLVNTDDTAKTNVTVADNLGIFKPAAGPEIVPLSYVGGSVLYYQNGILQSSPSVSAGPPLVISGITIPAGGNVIILYEVKANEYAPRGENATIKNSVEATGEGLCEELSDSTVISTRNEPMLSIAKAICPESVSCGDQVTYTFIIQNTGNTPVVATDNLVVSDLFNPVLTDIVASLNGTPLSEESQYAYTEQTAEFTTIGGAILVPAATFTRDSETGLISTAPGVAVLTVSGRI